MSDVDRWYPNAYGEMQDYPTGEYVLASDYDALRARLDRALRLLRIGLDVGLEPHERAEANALLAECTANNGDERHG